MKKSVKTVVLSLLILLLAGGGSAFLTYYVRYKKANVAQESVLKIYRSYTYAQAMDSLKGLGAIKNWKSFSKATSSRELEKYFEPGRYLIKEGMGNQAIIRMIANGWQTPVKMTFRGYTRRLNNLAYAFSKWFEADSASFAQVLNDKELIDSLGFTPDTFIGMFIPNTYEIYWTISPKNLVLRFKKEYDHFWNADRLAKAAAMKMTPSEVVTLASIVAEETNTPSEWPKIAGVYVNRLKKRMRLGACPTVKYVVIEDEPDIRRILNKHLRVDSPYNTYTHYGLPPGPITVPPAQITDAVLNYEKTDYLYFCAKPEFDGTHNFSATYAQHQKYSRAYNKAFNAREREKKAAAAAAGDAGE